LSGASGDLSKVCRKLRPPLAYKNQCAFNRLATVHKLQLANRDCVIPLEMLGQEIQSVPLVGRIEVVELIALGFENSDPLVFAFPMKRKDEIGIYFVFFPALYTVLCSGDVSMPPRQRLFAVEINRDIALIGVQFPFVDGPVAAVVGIGLA
jgi:hypothetical protein